MIHRLVELAVANAFRDVGVRETGGNNRGTRVEQYQRRAGGKPGQSWCYAALYTWFDDAARSMLIPNPLKKTMSVHTGWNHIISVQGVRVLKAPVRGCLLFHDSGHGHGHVGICTDTSVPAWRCASIEGNTNKAGSREGDEVAEQHRSIDYWSLGMVDIRPPESIT